MNVLGKGGMVILIVLNTLTLLLGIALLAVGAYLYDQSGLLDDDIIPLLDELGVGTFTLGDLLRIVCIIVIVLGCFIAIVSSLGDVGAIFRLRPVLVIYGIIIILIIVAEIVVLAAWFQFKRDLNATIKQALLDALKTYKGFTPRNTNILTIAWNLLFLLLECCGVNAYGKVNDFENTDWWSDLDRGSDVIPGYCCVGATAQTAYKLNGTVCTTAPNSDNAYINKGCYDGIDNLLSSYSHTFLSICFIIIATEVIAVVCSCLMIWQITVDVNKKMSHKGRVMAAPHQTRADPETGSLELGNVTITQTTSQDAKT